MDSYLTQREKNARGKVYAEIHLIFAILDKTRKGAGSFAAAGLDVQ